MNRRHVWLLTILSTLTLMALLLLLGWSSAQQRAETERRNEEMLQAQRRNEVLVRRLEDLVVEVRNLQHLLAEEFTHHRDRTEALHQRILDTQGRLVAPPPASAPPSVAPRRTPASPLVAPAPAPDGPGKSGKKSKPKRR